MRSLKAFDRFKSLSSHALRPSVSSALRADASRDVTTNSLGLKGTSRAKIIAKSDGVLAGVLEAESAFSGMTVHWNVKEGTSFRSGQTIALLSGDTRKLLAAERTALNYLMLLSGIATLTRRWVDRFGPPVASLRKTHPGMSLSEKRAVAVGGGLTHRLSLGDAILLKENHLAAFSRAQKLPLLKGIPLAVEKAVRYSRSHPVAFVEVEVRNNAEARAAVSNPKFLPTALLLDNCTPAQVKQIAAAIRKIAPSVLLEASGGITEQNAARYLKAGVDLVSTSVLTLQAKPVDLSLLVL